MNDDMYDWTQKKKAPQRYFAVPGYEGGMDFHSEPHVVNEQGELVARFEDLDECIMFVEAVNRR